MMRTLPAILALLLAAIRIPAATVEILATSDLHGRAEEFAALLPQLDAAGTEAIRIDCGDTIQGSVLSRFDRGGTMIELLNRAKFDFWVAGNHDFELGFEPFSDLVRAFRGEALGADWEFRALRPAPWRLLRRGEITVALIGLTDPKMPLRMLPGEGAEFLAPATALRRVMPEIRRAHPDLVVLAWHNGLYSAAGPLWKLLREFPEIDLVIGGHSHEEHAGERVGNAWFVQPGSHAACFAQIRAEFDDETRELLRIDSALVRPDPARRPSPELRERLERVRRAVETAAARPIATTPEPLRLPRKREFNSPFGALGAAALREVTGADAALFCASALEKEIPRQVTPATLHQLLPYPNRICVIELSRDELRELIVELLESASRRRSVPTFTGIAATADRSGNLLGIDAPERLTLALTDYTLTSSRTLRPLLDQPGRSWRVTGQSEFDAVAAFLGKSAGAPVSGPGWLRRKSGR